jgi:hypothetical protein
MFAPIYHFFESLAYINIRRGLILSEMRSNCTKIHRHAKASTSSLALAPSYDAVS